jgi:hypothetical protein
MTGVGSAALLTLAAACTGGSSYQYRVSGMVEAAQIDYDCHQNLAMEPAGFVTGNRGRTSSSSGSGSSNLRKAPTPRRTSPSRPQGGSSVRQPGLSKKTPVTKKPSSRGVTLSRKPDKPERITKVPIPKYRHKPHGCKVDDYELFIRNSNGLFEQDVRHVDYLNCTERKLMAFPRCTKN